MNRLPRSIDVRVPASTSNLGAGFDCFGLALQLYLTARATIVPRANEACRVRTLSDDAPETLPRTAENLIFRAMRFAAEREGLTLPPVRLAVRNPIPVKRGLGSSAAAIVCGIKLGALVCDRDLAPATVLSYAAELEGHADNVAAAIYGGWVVTSVEPGGRVHVVKRRWPPDVKVLVVSPATPLETSAARARLPPTVALADAVYNLQRAALFIAAMDERAYPFLWDAMHDRLHQTYRAPLVPGLADALATPQLPGLLGVALSGAGPSIIALLQDNHEAIGETIVRNFRRHDIAARVRLLEVDTLGLLAREHARHVRAPRHVI